MRKPKTFYHSIFENKIYTIVFFLIIGILLRWIHLWQYGKLHACEQVVCPDASEYWQNALAILHGVPMTSAIHAPLYPYFLAFLAWVARENVIMTRFLQSLIVLFAGLPLHHLLWMRKSKHVSWQRHIPAVFLCLYVLHPPFLAMQCEFFAENLCLICLACNLFFLFREENPSWQSEFLSGIFAGLSVITHPLSILFIFMEIVISARHFCRKRHIILAERIRAMRPMFFFLLLSGFIISGVILTRSIAAVHFVPVQENGGFNFWLGNHVGDSHVPGLCSVPPGSLWEEVHQQFKETSPVRATFDSWANAWESGNLKSFLLLPLKMFYPVSPMEYTTWSDLSPLGLTWIHRYFYHTSWLVIYFTLLSLMFFIRNRKFRKDMQPFLLLLSAFWISQTLLVSSGRYRMPMQPAFFALSSCFLCRLPALVRIVKKRKTLCFLGFAPAVILLLGMIPMYLPNSIFRTTTKEYASTCLAQAALMAGDTESALRTLKSIRIPEHSPIWNRYATMLATVHLERHEYEEARAVLPAEPKTITGFDDASVLAVYARYYGDTGQYEAGEKAYREVLKYADEGDMAVSACYNFAVMLQSEGKFEAAKTAYQACLELNPVFYKAISNLGVIAIAEERFADAIQYFSRALSMDSKNPNRIVNLATAHFMNGDAKAAEKVLLPLIQSGNAPEHALELMSLLREQQQKH